MGKLLGEEQKLAMGNFQVLRRRTGWSLLLVGDLGATDDLDLDRDATFLLDLQNRDRSIGAIQNTFNQTPLRVARPISKLWHSSGNLVRNPKSGKVDDLSPGHFDIVASILRTGACRVSDECCSLHRSKPC